MSSTAKGKEPAKIPHLPNPSTGSANPSASLSSLWAYLTPALDHIVKSSTNDTNKAPSIDVDYYSGVHSACYNYITSQTEAYNASSRKSDEVPMSGTDLYDLIDKYFGDTCRELLLGAPQDDSDLIHYIIPCFNRYSAGAQSANRLLNYINRHYVKRGAIDEDKGWLTVADIFEHVAKTAKVTDTREQLAKKLREKRTDELKKWGDIDAGPEALADAEACAQAASGVDRIVPISALAHRRFRIEFVEPLLAIPKFKKGKKAKNKIPNSKGSGPPPGPKGRLARAVKELLESSDVEEDERARQASELAKMLRKVGVRPDHPLRKKLGKYQAVT
ncbi:hypothetical protein GYMLUDRAFT_99952 [Collybiopsis luxurians FD-317 M1]|uniref:Unplaced genomic scaffold GYMLUscaffold_66, whole genome shotgun sequence n=1 Tax=Collybiopsis luxurians FD-317 M1 TaxID=944289 RepID=A0A0D0BXT2_9AGAR|nr:hypothetical protein GYMLUDRAFT_99952 [Collybiopsis luxurians FD-317 M1]